MDVTFVEHAEHHVHREQRCQNQERLIFQTLLENFCGALIGAGNRGWHANARHGVADFLDRR